MRSTSRRVLAGVLALTVSGALMGTGAITSSASAAPTAAARVTTTSLAAAAPVAGTPITLTATVSPTPTGGTVTFVVGTTTLSGCSKRPLSAGRASCSTTFRTAGSTTVTAKFSGVTAAFKASSGSRNYAVAAASGAFLGSLGSCTTTAGALVAVDFGHWNGPKVRGCDPNPTTGINLLTAAGFTTTGTQHDGPYFICRISHPLYSNNTPRPTTTEDPCVRTPPSSAYWSYWVAAKGANTWTYSPLGVYSDHPAAGTVEAWTFGATDTAGTTGQPSFTPNQVRVGLPTAAPARAALRKAAATPDLSKGVGYLVSQLQNGQYYDPYGLGQADIGLTLDGALALAAAGTADATLATVVDYVGAHQNDYTDLTGQYSQYASGGSVAKVAVVAEATGFDPRAFHGVDLIAGLDRLLCTRAEPDVCGGAGNYRYATSVFSQALGVIAQLRAGDGAHAAGPIAYLESLQLPTGGFPSLIPAGTSGAETDSTAMAAMALALVPGAKARTALAKALAWLAAQQAADGGFPGASGDSVNSAAVAVPALRLDAMTYAGAIAKAESFLAAEQNSDGGFDVAAGADGSDIRASTQAVSGTVGIPFGSVLDDLAAKTAAAQGANYLVSKLIDGDHYVFDGTTFDDPGLTSDALFALLGTGGHADAVTRIVQYLKGQVDSYADPSGTIGGPYSGAAAKLILVAEATGNDPASFGNVDLLQLLRTHVCDRAIAGQFSPCVAAGDFYNAFSTISQALGVLALQASPNAGDHLSVTSAPVARLHQLQCADGGFTSVLLTPGQKCTSDVDTTGFVVQALATVEGTDTWLGAAQAYLQNIQLKSGLYPGTAGANSNSTALAAQGLQTLVAALTAPTADPPQPKTIAPVAAWQSALVGLRGLTVAGGGFGISTNASADLRSSAQAVLAAAQSTLVAQVGATVQSLPRAPDVAPTPPTTPTGGPTATPPAGGAGGAGGGLADTGSPVGGQLGLAGLLLVIGAGLAYAGRRRVALLGGRHRTAARRRR